MMIFKFTLSVSSAWTIVRALTVAEKATIKTKRSKHKSSYAMEAADYSQLMEHFIAHMLLTVAVGNAK